MRRHNWDNFLSLEWKKRKNKKQKKKKQKKNQDVIIINGNINMHNLDIGTSIKIISYLAKIRNLSKWIAEERSR